MWRSVAWRLVWKLAPPPTTCGKRFPYTRSVAATWMPGSVSRVASKPRLTGARENGSRSEAFSSPRRMPLVAGEVDAVQAGVGLAVRVVHAGAVGGGIATHARVQIAILSRAIAGLAAKRIAPRLDAGRRTRVALVS